MSQPDAVEIDELEEVLDAEVICESSYGCDAPAEWRVTPTSFHLPQGMGVVLICGHHYQMHTRAAMHVGAWPCCIHKAL